MGGIGPLSAFPPAAVWGIKPADVTNPFEPAPLPQVLLIYLIDA